MAGPFTLICCACLTVAATPATPVIQSDPGSPGVRSDRGSTKARPADKNALPDKDSGDSAEKPLAPRAPTGALQLWGFWSGDNFFYPGQIERSQGERLLFRFDDGDSAWLAPREVADVALTVGMSVHGNWQRRGAYYHAKILAQNGSTVRVQYNDGEIEDTTRAHLRLAFHPWELFTPGRRVLARWGSDGYWYPGTVQQLEAARCQVRFDDGQVAWLGKDGVALIQIYRGLRIEVDFRRRGRYFPATIQRVDGERMRVLYDDGEEEETTVSCLRRTLSLVGN